MKIQTIAILLIMINLLTLSIILFNTKEKECEKQPFIERQSQHIFIDKGYVFTNIFLDYDKRLTLSDFKLTKVENKTYWSIYTYEHKSLYEVE